MAVPVLRNDARQVIAEAATRLRLDLAQRTRRRFPSLDPEEVCQRATLRALERADELRDLARVEGWIRRIHTTTALDMLRGRGEYAAAQDAEEDVPAGDVCGCTLALLTTLPKSYVEILQRVDVEGTGLSEVATALHIAPGNAAVRLHRARRALRTRLREHCGVESMRQCLSCVCVERGCCRTA